MSAGYTLYQFILNLASYAYKTCSERYPREIADHIGGLGYGRR